MLAKMLIATLLFIGPGSLGISSSGPKEVVGDSEDQPYIAIGKAVPGFAGVYFEESVMHVLLQEPTEQIIEQARMALIPGPSDYFPSSTIAHRADYSYLQLAKWKDIAIDQMGPSNSHLAYISMKENRLVLELNPLTLVPEKVIEEIVERGVPKEALVVIELYVADEIPPLMERPPYELYTLLILTLLGMTLSGRAIKRKVSRSRKRGKGLTSQEALLVDQISGR